MLAAALSATLCLAAIFLWIRSQTNYDAVSIHRTTRYWSFSSLHGRFHIQRNWAAVPYWDHKVERWGGDLSRMTVGHIPFTWDGGGIAWGTQVETKRGVVITESTFVVSYWLLVLVIAVIPAVWIRKTLLRRNADARERRGCCRECGYDLRASPQRCPECGTAVPNRNRQTVTSASGHVSSVGQHP